MHFYDCQRRATLLNIYLVLWIGVYRPLTTNRITNVSLLWEKIFVPTCSIFIQYKHVVPKFYWFRLFQINSASSTRCGIISCSTSWKKILLNKDFIYICFEVGWENLASINWKFKWSRCKPYVSLHALVLGTKLQNGGGLSTRPHQNVVWNAEWSLEPKILQHANRLLNLKRQYLSLKNIRKA